MATVIVLASGNLLHSIELTKRLLILKSTTAIGFQVQQLHVGSSITSRQARRDFSVYSFESGNHTPPTGDSPSSWQQWIIGIIITVIVPFFSRKWSKALKIKDEVDTVIEEVEKIVDCVEEVAETVEKVAKDVTEHLPEGGKWRDTAIFVEGVAEEIAREAHLVEDFLHEVEDVEEKAELLVESVKDQNKNVHEDSSAS